MAGRIALLLGAAFLLSLMVAQLHPQRKLVQQGLISSLDLAEALKLRPLWVDARSQEDFLRGHIPGAISLDSKHWEAGFSRAAQLVRPGSVLVVYCSSQSCHSSQETALRLKRELGLASIYTLRGGYESWKTAPK